MATIKTLQTGPRLEQDGLHLLHNRGQDTAALFHTRPTRTLLIVDNGTRSRSSGGTVFALAGGGNLGAVQVGVLHAVLEERIVPDAIVGTSIGALNGAFLAGHADVTGIEKLAELWLSVRRNDDFPLRPRRLISRLFSHQGFLWRPIALRNLLVRARLGFTELEAAHSPLGGSRRRIGERSEAVVLSRRRAIDALLGLPLVSACRALSRWIARNGRHIGLLAVAE